MTQLTKLHRDNLLALAVILEEASDGQFLRTDCANGGRTVAFDMGMWHADHFRGMYSSAPECGTTACALGYAAIHDHFRTQGLTRSSSGFQVRGNNAGADEAAMEYFGIDAYYNIFTGPVESHDPLYVAGLIRRLVERKTKEEGIAE